MADFPSRTRGGTGRTIINPTSRSFTFGDYPIKEYRSLSGSVMKRAFGDRAFNYKLQLVFANVEQDVVASIFDHYHGQGGALEGFSIPSSLLSGYNDTITSRIQAPDRIQWFYEASPEVESVGPSLSTVSLSLIGELPYQ
jgi:hypothetical protein